MRDLRDWMALLSAIGHLALAITALVSGRKSPLGRPLAALCFVLFGWNFATPCGHIFGGKAFEALDGAFTAISPAALLEVVVRFVGEHRARVRARALIWTGFGGLGLASLLAPFASTEGVAWLNGSSWPLIFLAMWLPTLAFDFWLLVRHLRSSSDPAESARTRTVFAAVAVGAVFATSDILHGIGLPLPYLGSIGTLIAAGLLATCTIRFGLLERNVSARSTIYVVAMVGAFVVAYLAGFQVFAGNLAGQAFVTFVISLVVVVVGRELVVSISEARSRTQKLAVVGRFSAQMTHDLRSPLTALLGAMQVIEAAGDEPSPKQKKTQKEMIALAVAQAERIAAIVDRYDRMARVEPRMTIVRIDEILQAIARAHRVAGESITLGVGDTECDADPELLTSAIDNVVKNAVEASSHEKVRVESLVANDRVIVRVIDHGPGMDARTRARAFEDFFTTKTTGSGLGLAFVERVMLAHRGTIHLESELGAGTTVTLALPVRSRSGSGAGSRGSGA